MCCSEYRTKTGQVGAIERSQASKIVFREASEARLEREKGSQSLRLSSETED